MDFSMLLIKQMEYEKSNKTIYKIKEDGNWFIWYNKTE